MSLEDLIDNTRTNKNTLHSYLSTYETLFKSKKETATKILEIGIYNGGSIKLWKDYFINAKIYSLDINNSDEKTKQYLNNSNIILYTPFDAYNTDVFNNLFVNSPDTEKFDIIIDDGPHTIGTMITFIKLYSQLLKDDGILIIEDVQSIEWINTLNDAVPDDLKNNVSVYDLRSNKGRYDDILFVINKSI
jgi:cephalosporin hydroxylase|uniref:Methyltransferase domain-containing protein n=1 Tax=viral metagenome TaxID=1070528 RepID=A0A6C0DL66_9ZZZZ